MDILYKRRRIDNWAELDLGNQIQPCITQNHVFRATPYVKDRSHSAFLSTWGNTFGQDYFLSTGKQTTNLASINKGVLSAFPTPLPPLEEQRRIIDLVEERLSAISKLEAEIEEKLVYADQEKQAILADAFSGRLVEAQNGDGDTSELLHRILTEARKSIKITPKQKRRKKHSSEELSVKHNLIYILKEQGEISVSALMNEAGYGNDEIEAFYEKLAEISDSIVELRPSDNNSKNWPYESEVRLKLK